MFGSSIVKNSLVHDAHGRGEEVLKIGRKLTQIEGVVLCAQSWIHQRRSHIGVAREEPSAQKKVPMEGGFRTQPVIERIGVGYVPGLLQCEEDALL